MKPQDITNTLNQIVSYRNILYKFVSAVIKKSEDGDIYYLSELRDLNANSICIVRLEDVNNG